MNQYMKTSLYAGIVLLSANQACLANTFDTNSDAISSFYSQRITHKLEQQRVAPIILAAGVDTRVERRVDAVQNSADRVDDKQDHREDRRDCTGDGADCRSDNRQDKRGDTVDRAEERVDDRQDRR